MAMTGGALDQADRPSSGASVDDAEVLLRLVTARHSCRAFLTTEVPRPVVNQILEIARQTASWSNVQPWQLVITSGAATERFRVALSKHAASAQGEPDLPFPRAYRDEYMERRRTCAASLYASLGLTSRTAVMNQRAENFRFFGAPHVALLSTDDSLGVYGAIDCGAYISAFMLAAHSMGIGSVAQASIAQHSAFVREYLAIPDDRRVICAISFGYEDVQHPANRFRTSRLSVDQVATWLDR